MAEKRCKQCGAMKPLDDFHKDKSCKDGRRSLCKNPCQREYDRKHYEDSREGYLEYNHKYQKAYPEYNQKYREAHREELKERARKYYAEHRVRRHEYRKERRKENREYACKYRREHQTKAREANYKWRKEHPEKEIENNRRRRARKQDVAENFTTPMARFVRKYWDNRCVICGKTQKEEGQTLAIDHWMPLSNGNPLTMSNSVLMCRSCNSSKHDKLPSVRYDAETVKRIERSLAEQQSAYR